MKLRITVLKYHSWYLCQILPQIMLLPTLIYFISEVNQGVGKETFKCSGPYCSAQPVRLPIIARVLSARYNNYSLLNSLSEGTTLKIRLDTQDQGHIRSREKTRCPSIINHTHVQDKLSKLRYIRNFVWSFLLSLQLFHSPHLDVLTPSSKFL